MCTNVSLQIGPVNRKSARDGAGRRLGVRPDRTATELNLADYFHVNGMKYEAVVMETNGEVPRFLTNVTLETYEQYSHGGTCMGCHAKAMTLAGQDATFSFLLSKAR